MNRLILAIVAVGLWASPASAAGGSAVNTAKVQRQSYNNIIRPQGLCHMVDNAQSGSKAQGVFVPYNKPQEWSAFVNNKPAGVTVAACCEAQSFQVCDDRFDLPVTRSGSSISGSVRLTIREGQSYRISCMNTLSGVWQTLDGTGGADNVVRTRSPSTQGAWVVKFNVNASTPTAPVTFQCQNHSWQMTQGPSNCAQPLPPGSLTLVSATNCFPDHVSPYGGPGAGVDPLCRVHAPATGPHRYENPGPWLYPSGNFNNSWGRSVLYCLPPTPIY